MRMLRKKGEDKVFNIHTLIMFYVASREISNLMKRERLEIPMLEWQLSLMNLLRVLKIICKRISHLLAPC